MQTTDVRRRSPVETALDIAIAPRAACAALRIAPTWLWAFSIASLAAIAATIAIAPVTMHVMGIELPTRLAADPQLAQLPAAARSARIAQIVSIAQTTVRFSFIAIPFAFAFGSLLQALIMLVANAIGKGDGSFKHYWALAVNAGLIGTGLSSVALAIIVLLRGQDSFAASSEIAAALPGLGTFVAPGAKAAAAFLGAFNVFAMWNAAVLALGMTVIGRVPRATAVGAALVILVGSGCIPLAGALFQK